MIRRLLRRLIIWAVTEPKPKDTLSRLGFDVRLDVSVPKDAFILGASTPEGRQVIVNAVRQAKRDREL